MAGWIGNVQIECAGSEIDALASLYGELLGMQRYHPGYVKLAKEGGGLEIGFETDGGPGNARARWPDPEHPQQVHLDIEVGDLDAGEEVVLRQGATPLCDYGDHRVYADPAGHPFCLYLDSHPDTDIDAPMPGRLARIVFDCFSPRAVASYYEELLDMRDRVVDSVEHVVIAGGSGGPMLAFQHAVFPAARWPDPAHPAQLHLDLVFDDATAALALMERLGTIRLAVRPLHVVYADPAAHPFCGPAAGYVFVQDIPPGTTTIEDLPEDWSPGLLPVGRAQVIGAVMEVAPDADFSDPSRGRIQGAGYDIQIEISDESPLPSFVCHVRGRDRDAANMVLRTILQRLDLRAFDPEVPGYIFS